MKLSTHNKQIVYPPLSDRMFAYIIDLIVLMLLRPITNLCNVMIFQFAFRDFPDVTIENFLYQNDKYTITPDSELFNPFITYVIVMIIITTIIFAIYFILLWDRFGCTLGGYFMRMRIVDATSLAKPTIGQFIKRFVGYIFTIFNIFGIMFDSKKRGLLDKISGVVVIKV